MLTIILVVFGIIGLVKPELLASKKQREQGNVATKRWPFVFSLVVGILIILVDVIRAVF